MIAQLEAGGHEHALGSGLADADGAYVPRLAQVLGIPTVINRAQADAQYAGIEGGIVSIPKQTWQGIDRSSRVSPLTSGSALVVLDGGRNDALAYGQPTVIMRDAFKHGLRATICAYRSCRLFPADDPLLTYSGSWAAIAVAADWLGAVTRAVGANADYVEAPVPASWPGGYGFIVCPQDDTAHGAVFTVTVDGVSKGTLDTRTAAITGTVCPATLRFAIPANATTVRVTASSFATAARFNHIGFEVPQGSGHTRAFPAWTEGYSPPVVVVCQDPRPNSYGATGLHDGSYPPLASDYVADVVNEFATALVVAADLETHMQKRADHFQGSDTFAPNEYGHIKLAAILSTHARAGLKPIDHAMLTVPAPAASSGGALTYDETVLATPDLISYWPMDEPNGTTGEDVEGGHDGTYSGTVKLNQPGVDMAATGFLDVPNVAALQNLATWTLEAWVRPYTAITSPSLVESQFSSKINYVLGFSQTGGSGGELETGYYQGGWHTARESVAVPSITGTEWQHCVGTYDGTTIKLYRNGKLVASTAHSASPTADAGAHTYIGKQSSGGSAVLNAFERRAAMYSRALTAAEVLEHYEAGR